MSDRTYLTPEKRRRQILNAAVIVASRPGGWSSLTRKVIAVQAACSPALVTLYLGDMPAVRKAVFKVACKDEIVEIIAQSVAAHDGYAVKPALRNKAVSSLLG